MRSRTGEATDEMMCSRVTARYLAVVAAPRVGALLLVVLLGHLIFMASPQASLLTLVLSGPLLGWMSGCSAGAQKTRPQANANGPPRFGDRQALLQVFRI